MEHRIQRLEWRPAVPGYTVLVTRRAKSTGFLKDTIIILSFSTIQNVNHFWKTWRLLYFIFHMISKLQDSTIALFIAIVLPFISGRHIAIALLHISYDLKTRQLHYLIYTENTFLHHAKCWRWEGGQCCLHVAVLLSQHSLSARCMSFLIN